jgi:serine/threonine-protein kinase
MSPEQILGSKDIDHRSDLWSVGVVAYEMLTGKKPFDAETMGGLAIRIHSEPLPLPTDANPELPIDVDAWFARACARDVNARFASANELAVELARALGGRMPKSLDGAPRLSTGGASKRVNPVAATLAAGAATDAGVVRANTQSRSRSRLLVLLAIFVIVPPIVFVGFRTLLRRDTATALVPSEHVASAGGSATPSGSTSTITTAGTGPAAPASAAVAPSPAAASAEPASAVVAPKTPAHGPRARPPSTPAPPSVHAAAASPLPLPSPPATSTPTPRPATSGNDIF